MLQIIQFSNEEASRIFEAKGDNDLVISYSWSQFTEETNESVPTNYLGVMRKTPIGAQLSRNLKYFAHDNSLYISKMSILWAIHCNFFDL